MKLGILLADHIAVRQTSLRALAKEIGCDHTTLHRLVRDEPCRMDTFTKVMIWLTKPTNGDN